MRVLFVGPFPGQRIGSSSGGVGECLASLASGLAAVGDEVHVCVPGGSDLVPSGIVQHLTTVDSRGGPYTGFAKYRACLSDIAASVKPDVIGAHGVVPHGYASVRAVGDVPVAVTAHGSIAQDIRSAYPRIQGYWRSSVAFALERTAVERADLVVDVVSDWKLNLRTKPSQLVHVPNPVDQRFFDVAPTPSERRVLYLGGGKDIKGWRRLAEAWGKVSNPKTLVVAGWERDADDLMSLLDRAERKTIEIRGWMSRDEVIRELSTATLAAVPSDYEVAPLAVFQAWAAGVPVVCTRVGGLNELPSGSVFHVDSLAPASFAAGLEAALRDAEVRCALAEKGRTLAEAHRPSRTAADYRLALATAIATRAAGLR